MDKLPLHTFKSRIAPTPSGFLHMGNLYSFLLTWLSTKLNNGKLLLRIDDMDSDRCRDEYLLDIFETLEFFGIGYDQGPLDMADFKQNFTQTRRLEKYYGAVEKLKSQRLVYACICSRKDMYNGNQADPLHCKEKALPLETPNAALRIGLAPGSIIHFTDVFNGAMNIDLLTAMPDFAVQQKNKLPSYQICSLVDDLESGITHIVRGVDLLPSTAAQLHLANLLNEKRFQQTRFLHHPLLKAANSSKLSKSAGDTSIKSLRSKGFTLKQILIQIVNMFGINNCEPDNIQELLQFIIAHDGQEIGIFAGLKQLVVHRFL